ncbi:MAG: Npt1/Npt2 family nucleotide transporter [Rickettsiales bacterium]
MQNSRVLKRKSWYNIFTKIAADFNDNKQYLLYKYLPTSLMLLLSAYINSFLRGVKDAVLVPSLGAELISFIKFYGVFPGTVIFLLCFTKLANILSRDKLFYAITSFFGGFFLLYAFVLSPYQEYLQPDLSHLIEIYPSFKYQIIMVQHWTTSLLYIMCEICGTVTLSLLFWQFANELYTLHEAKKTYASFGIIGQGGIILSGLVQSGISEYFSHSNNGEMLWDVTLKWMMSTVALSGLGLILLYKWIYKNVFFNPVLCTRKHSGNREKVSLSVKQSLKYVFSSKYLWLIMLIVFCYGVGVNLVESVWKYQLKQVYTTKNSYSAFMGQFNMYFGIVSILVMVFGTYIIRKFRWLIPALYTPLGAGITGATFFTLLIFKDLFEPFITSINSTVLMMAVILGSAQVILFKSLNYTFVDATKEMAFMPLDRELRTKGKAAVDVIGNRFGKAFGAISQQLMFQFINPSIGDLTYEICIFFVLIITIWVYSVFALNREFIKIADHAEH